MVMETMEAFSLPKCCEKASRSMAATNEGPEPCRRKSAHSTAASKSAVDTLPSAPKVPLTIFNLGNRPCSIAATSGDRSLEAQRRVSASGKCCSMNASTPGVCAMSPMFTACHDDRRRMHGGKPDTEAGKEVATAVAGVA